jgi:hypothetical protein
MQKEAIGNPMSHPVVCAIRQAQNIYKWLRMKFTSVAAQEA